MNNVGLFIVSYEITSGLLGAPTFHVNLVVSTPDHAVNGQGSITNGSIHPPLEVRTRLHGDFTYMTVMPNNTHILVVAQGDALTPPTQPILVPNTKLRMVLSDDWSTGTATFSYFANGEWNTVNNAKVTKVNANNTVPVTPEPVAQN